MFIIEALENKGKDNDENIKEGKQIQPYPAFQKQTLPTFWRLFQFFFYATTYAYLHTCAYTH